MGKQWLDISDWQLENYQLAEVATANVTKVVDDTHTNVAEDEFSVQAPANVVDLPPEYDFDTHRQLNSRIWKLGLDWSTSF